ncbi:hypothetical protein EsDP_00006651 [Epichloe bromicola]|uniref:Zn(2)-C6 fungal-type domain-containing protein n=1 Tax=Epichloe bromicola TaxID=79588 RepID=A0ABQ0CY84_9HYPO
MPQKRRAGGTPASSNDQGDDGKAKKRRVSLACDACRAAREKCDGARPRCGTCVALDRACQYTPATKKRGVQTGYLRTIELSLAWLFDQMPESERALHQLLVQPASGRKTRALLGKGSAGHHLQKVWNETRVRKAIDSILSDSHNGPSDNSDDESNAGGNRLAVAPPPHDGGRGGASNSRLTASRTTRTTRTTRTMTMTMHESTNTPVPDRGVGAVLKLPSHWKRLVNVYISYTHCWLPIVRPDALRSLAASYGANGVHVDLDGDRSAFSHHSELWAALAIASFQDVSHAEYRHSTELSPSHIFRVARNLIPEDDETYDIHTISALILHSAVFIGRGNFFSASLLLGKAARLLKRLQLIASSMPLGPYNSDKIQLDTAGIACSLLDTLTSLSLNQHAVSEVCDTASTLSPSTAEFSGFDQAWQSVPNADLPEHSQPTTHPTMEPIRTLIQLHALTTVLGSILHPRLHADGQARPVGPEDLVQKLDPRFHYCNSLVSSSSTPMIPSAFLVKLLFLTATIELASRLRSSLLSGFLEMVESCFANFGASRTPPVVSLLLHIVQKRARVDEMSEAEQSNWHSAVGKLHSIWQDGAANSFTHAAAPAVRADELLPQRQDLLPQKTFTPMQTVVLGGQKFDTHARPGPPQGGGFGLDDLAGDKHEARPRFGYQPAVPHPGYAVHEASLAAHPGDGREDTQPAFPGGYRINQSFDYDALFEDLGSIGYTDTVEMDTRFMTNLGFAPGCDLAEIFQGDLGV